MSHCGKPLCKVLAAAIAPQYNSAMPDTQFGATALRGADSATHILVTFMEICRKSKKSFFVLFVDLVKAIDRVIRELVFGIPPGVTDVSKHLSDLGLDVSVSLHVHVIWTHLRGSRTDRWNLPSL